MALTVLSCILARARRLGRTAEVTYRDVFGGGEGFYLVQVQPVSGDAESQ